MSDDTRQNPESLVTGAEIARMAGVTRAAVSNWRRRHADFPAPAGGGPTSPLFSLSEIQAWLDRQQKGHETTDEVRLWQGLRGAYGDDIVRGLAAVMILLAEGAAPQLRGDIAEQAGKLASHASAAEVVKGLSERFMDSARRAGSDQITPQRLADVVQQFAAADCELTTGTVFDPACGSGTLLLSVLPASGLSLRGQEVDPDLAHFAQLRAELTGHTDTVVQVGDSLRDDQWQGLDADLVVCDPPSAAPDWGREDLLLDPRWEFGIPPRAENELAWLQHCYAHTAPGGRVLIVMPTSVAYRKAGRRIRAELVRRGALTQVVALPAGLAAAHSAPVHLWQLRRPTSPAEAATHVRMIDLSANAPDGGMEPRADQMVEIPLVQLLDDVTDLSPTSHVGRANRNYPTEYATARDELAALVHEFMSLLPELTAGLGPGSLDSATVSVSDLARAGLVAFEDEAPTSTSDHLDTDYLHGFLRSAANTRRSTSSSGSFRLDARGSRIPQMPIEAQRRYGSAFRSLDEFERCTKKLAELSERAAGLARDGLTNGALTPSETDG